MNETSNDEAVVNRAPEELLRSNEELRLAIDTMPGLVWSSLPDGYIDYLNERWLTYTGLTLESGRGWGWQSAVHPDDLPGLVAYWKSILSCGTSGQYEARLRRHDGDYRWFLFHGEPLYAPDGRLIKWYGSNTDVEDLRASEHLARGQLDALARILEGLSRESSPQKFLEHVLRTICEQFDAHSLSIWGLVHNQTRLQLLANFENGAVESVRGAAISPLPHPGLTQAYHPVWSEFFTTGSHCVIGSIQPDTILVRRAEDKLAQWHDWSYDLVVNESSQTMSRRLYAKGVTTTLAIPMIIAGRVSGLVSIRFKQCDAFRPEQIQLGRALAHQAMLAIELRRMSEQSRTSAVIAERNRLARDIHDTLAQGFTGIIIQLEAADDALSRNLASDVQLHVSRARGLARESLNEARRSVRALRPPEVSERGLCNAIEALAIRVTRDTPVHLEFEIKGEPVSLPATWNDHILHICQEALTNTLRHANATLFTTCITFTSSHCQLTLRDNGGGFDNQRLHEGFGLLGIRERVEDMEGKLTIDTQTGSHTEIDVILTLDPQSRSLS